MTTILGIPRARSLVLTILASAVAAPVVGARLLIAAARSLPFRAPELSLAMRASDAAIGTPP